MGQIFRETWSGLRRNLTMTLAVVVTVWVSLTLFGAGLMAAQQVTLFKGRWYDKIELSVFMCVQDSKGGTCDPGNKTTDAQRATIKSTLEANPEVAQVYYSSQQDEYNEYRETYKGSPLLESVSVDQLADSFKIKLKNPEEYQGVVAQARSLPGVNNVVDLHTVLDPIFRWLNALQWGTMVMSGLLLLAAALQIANSIRIAAFSRRRELGIMRLVGASNFSIMAPFLLESLVTGLVGAALACGTLALGYWAVIAKNAEGSIEGLRWIQWSHAGFAMLIVVAVAVVLSIIPTLFSTRKYLRV